MRHAIIVGAAVAAVVSGCGGGGGDDNPPAPQHQFENSAYLTDDGELFFVPVVDGAAGAPQRLSQGLPTRVLPTSSRKIFTGTFAPATGTVERARFTEVVYFDGTALKKADLAGASPDITTIGTVDEPCVFEGIGVDLVNHPDTIVDVITAGPDHDCDDAGDAGRHFAHLSGTPAGVTVSANTGFAQPGVRDGSGNTTAMIGGNLADGALTLQRVDPDDFASSTVFTKTGGVTGGRRLQRPRSAGPNRSVIAFNFPDSDSQQYFLYDESLRAVREIYRVDHPIRRPGEPLQITNRAQFQDNILFIADKSAVVALDPGADPAVPRTVVDFGAGKSVERIIAMGDEIDAVVRAADDSLALVRFAPAGGPPTEITQLPDGSYSIVELPGDVILLTFTPAGGGDDLALAYDSQAQALTTYPASRWIGGTAITSPLAGAARVISRVGDTDIKLASFAEAYLLATRAADHSELKLVRRDALATAIPLGNTPVVTDGTMDPLGQRVLVELRVDHGSSIDRDIYLLDIGTPPRLVPIAATAGREEYLMGGQFN